MRHARLMRGPPWPGKHAPIRAEAPGFSPNLIEEGVLARARQAGGAGLPLGGDVTASIAIWLSLLGLVRISDEDPQRIRPVYRGGAV